MCAASGERYRSRLLSVGVGLAVGVEGVVEGGLESNMAGAEWLDLLAPRLSSGRLVWARQGRLLHASPPCKDQRSCVTVCV